MHELPHDNLMASIVRSKVQPPPVRVQTLTRGRLLDWMSRHRGDRLKLVMAEAGYGKTTLLADFSRRAIVRCLWFKLDPSDGDWVTFINYLIAAVREVEPRFAPATANLLRQLAAIDPTREIVMGSLMAELSALTDEPTLLILDDFHLVDESDDARAIVEQLIERAPEGFTILIASRRRPTFRLGRSAAQGQVAELSTDDLRFSAEETEELFRSTYGQPLDPDLLAEVDARTEGWGASLQLLHSSIRERRPSEARAFIREMSGAQGSLYDFLAEEVLGHLRPALQRFVTDIALLRRIVPIHAAALFANDAEPSTLSDVLSLLDEAEGLGLLGRSSTTSVSRRFHPLLHEFLVRRLSDRTTPDQRRAMHRLVATAAEPADWLTACHHYIEADEPGSAMRVLSESAADALGTGSWGPASAMLPRIKGIATPPAVRVLQARDLIEHGRPLEALGLLDAIDTAGTAIRVRALVKQVRLTALWRAGDGKGLRVMLDQIMNDKSAPSATTSIAHGYAVLIAAVDGGRLDNASALLQHLASDQLEAEQPYFAAVSLYNAMLCELARGAYQPAIVLGEAALKNLGSSHASYAVSSSIHATLATCLWERGLDVEAADRERMARTSPMADADAFADGALVAVYQGRLAEATELVAESASRLAAGHGDTGASDTHVVATAALLAAKGDLLQGRDLLERRRGDWHDLTVPTVAAILIGSANLDGDPERGLGHVDAALSSARSQGSWRHEVRLEVVRSALLEDEEKLRAAIARTATSGSLGLLQVADVICRSLHLLNPIPEVVRASISRYPARWLPLIRAQLSSANKARSVAAYRNLAEGGTRFDVPMVRAFEKTYFKGKSQSLGRAMAKRTGPTLVVRDLGPVELAVDRRVIALSDMRRKAAALLVFLITRARGAAAKEQVLDAMWPDLGPAAAANSLNQTLYFVRRDIDPFFVDGESPEYVVFENELVWLDVELVHSASWLFHGAAASCLAGGSLLDLGPATLQTYRGRFAPEFEYEDWSTAWRDGLHAQYLSLASITAKSLLGDGRSIEAIPILQGALTIDPVALDLEADLVRAYGLSGADTAAMRQYRHYAESYATEFGEDAPSLERLLGG